jgi:hypothetical protein
MSATMRDAALELVTNRHLAVFPLHSVVRNPRGGFICTCGKLSCKNSGKHPLGALVPHGFKQASTDERVVSHWWRCCDYANIGVATGTIVVLDVDPRNDGDHTLRVLEDEHGPLPPSWRVCTGGGGEHIYFRSTTSIPCSAGNIGAGLDVRGDGGYVVAPPSLHISGRQHTWNVDFHPDDVPLAPAPDWLVSLIERPAIKQTPSTVWRDLVAEGVNEGHRNASTAKLAGHLLRRYVDPHVVLELLLAWNAGRCRPPLPDSEIVTTVDSIARRELARRKAQ